ncbi:hypothetical protein G5B30_16420 [Sphingobacterium sp. SGG-5]|uniref:hypothetical protein n=1 Tax=Sphingobacterium sp. SGG-5 TaxID=2710881 RepID=UPI0013EBD4B4|nr:hypothetical protein [Sphingobacterium sp. SGG-5]NGM63495.1 hypothetical protein [Sphingobacterium sp. SGG-5]
MMKIYKHTGSGIYVGSCIIVAADNDNEAAEMIRKELDSWGLRNEKLNVYELEIKKGVVHVDNGDY